mmetsp:Transcript_9793/g.14448  ORF Transcript_9793/g.14448 Transcript_9793/m.14448 type:complete len:755 (-) Transcript_9793:35-2299(-)
MIISKKRVPKGRRKKKISIVPFEVDQSLPSNFEEEAWNKLKHTLQCIFEKKAFPSILEELYNKVQILCQHGKSASILKRLTFQCEDYVNNIYESIQQSKSNDPHIVVENIKDYWTTYLDHMIQMRNIFKVLDTDTAAFQGKRVNSLWDMALFIYRNKILNPEGDINTHYAYVEKNCLELILLERRGNPIDRSSLKSNVDMFIQLHLFYKFEKHLMISTREFHQANAKEKINSLPISMYLNICMTLIVDEESRCISYLPQLLRTKLKAIIYEEYITNYIPQILDKGLAQLILKKNYDALESLYELMKKGKGLAEFKDSLYSFVYETGKKLIEDPSQDKSLIENLLSFYSDIIHIQLNQFQNYSEFGSAIRESFTAFVRTRSHIPSILVAKYLDSKLQKGTRELQDVEFMKLVDQVFEIFYFCPGKDVFELFYQRGLARRLLLKKSSNREHEKYVIKMLRQELGSSLAKKLEMMFKDITTSETLNETFQKSEYAKENKDIEFYANVISTGEWPSFVKHPLNMPPLIGNIKNAFIKVYCSTNESRELQWVPILGSCVIKGLFKGNPDGIFLNTSVFQGLILLYCNNHNTFSFNDMKKHMGITDDQQEYVFELKRSFVSLTHVTKASHRMLLITNRDMNLKAKTINADDCFKLNNRYSRNSTRVSLPLPQMKENHQESKEMEEKALFDRKYIIQAAIVRIMKLSKVLDHRDLFVETVSQIAGRFTVVQKVFKQAIEYLIETSYIKRDEQNSRKYIYIS